jgi:hypothetical protein
MSCCGGINSGATLVAPVNDGDGASALVNTLAAKKTIYLSGDFAGSYTILGSIDNVNFVPLVTFTGTGPQKLKQKVDATLLSMRVRRRASGALPTILVAAQAVCACPPPGPGPG